MNQKNRDTLATGVTGFVVGFALIMALLLAFALVNKAEGHDPSDISLTGSTTSDCREPDENWRADFTLENDSANEFNIADTVQVQDDDEISNPVAWSNDDVAAGSSVSTSVNLSASVSTLQLVVTHESPAHAPQSFASNVVRRPELCPTPTPTATPEPTATPVPAATPEPTITLGYCVGGSKVVQVNGVITSVTEGDSDCAPPTLAPTTAPAANIIPPSTGSGGLR